MNDRPQDINTNLYKNKLPVRQETRNRQVNHAASFSRRFATYLDLLLSRVLKYLADFQNIFRAFRALFFVKFC